MRFTKMQGIGNDYVYVNCYEETVDDPHRVARLVSDRHFGIGSDGLILIRPSEVADCEMDMYNADGSSGAMCGNGIRCVAKYVYDHGIVNKKQITVATGSGIKTLEVTVGDDNKVDLVRVNMGSPRLEAACIPVISEKEQVIDEPITVGGTEYRMTGVSMGNPHAVVCVEDVDQFPLEKVGPLFEHHSCFPDRVNTEFIRVIDRENVQMRVWERGAGETWACGTGACAVAVACMVNGYTDRRVTVHLRGGDLEIFWDEESGDVYMTGPAREVFTGEIFV